MRHSLARGAALVALALAACSSDGGSGGGGGTPPIQAPEIVTTSVREGFVGQDYDQQLSASGGAAPLQWTLQAVASELSWLGIDTTSGRLFGTPSGPVQPARAFVVQVTDAQARTTQRTFQLSVRACVENETIACVYGDGTACLAGISVCTGGVPSACSGGVGSTTSETCGAACAACGPSALSCTDGRCKCGSGAPCSGTTPTCCGEVGGDRCVDLQGDPAHCGSCGTPCDVDRANVVPTCTGGTCDYPCVAGFMRCPPGNPEPGCGTNVAADPANCGSCGRVCPTATQLAGYDAAPLDPSCQAGECRITCLNRASDCDADVSNGCECKAPSGGSTSCSGATCVSTCPQGQTVCNDTCVNTANDLYNCGTCGRRCVAPTGGTASCTGGACVGSCPAGMALCGGRCFTPPATVTNGTVSASCVLTCSSAIVKDCDGALWNGCETSLHRGDNCLGCGDCVGGLCQFDAEFKRWMCN